MGGWLGRYLQRRRQSRNVEPEQWSEWTTVEIPIAGSHDQELEPVQEEENGSPVTGDVAAATRPTRVDCLPGRSTRCSMNACAEIYSIDETKSL